MIAIGNEIDLMILEDTICGNYSFRDLLAYFEVHREGPVAVADCATWRFK